MASTDAETAKKELEAARSEVVECEKQIQAIKEALRGVPATPDEKPNTLRVSAIKVSDLAQGASPSIRLQLSSPVEELTITKLQDPLDKDAEGSFVLFEGVDTSAATLSVSANDADIPLGTSDIQDVAPFCTIEDGLHPNPKVSEVTVSLFPSKSSSSGSGSSSSSNSGATTEEKKEEEKEEIVAASEPATKDDEETKESDDKAEKEATSATPDADATTSKETAIKKEETNEETTTTTTTTPICSVTFNVEFKPSSKDIREALHDMLNKVSKRKAAAIDNLRKSAAAVSRAAPPPAGGSTDVIPSQRAVKPGFLNAKSKKVQEDALTKFYNRFLGPTSLLRTVVPVVKNYIIFFGAVAFFHFRGQFMALPPPV
eukprot:CAMPEP_0118707196 /NCGR_PEP_ID=MMETSP0800-20121206/21039_1 /TAXON_ID=210618 ORGANISM="Striatella unipunctata, Strain CCMP2910" /NCGR_SAMPLE_ID=MMETSP0800 /ASSEMBLY_ACC=CAM_ASM_000638 /LENGTH=372 /DNA_ID=CAMNT_0006609935 /DNA_START=221 /DNA_END=1339 /DNA_ORIENTATION=-